MNSGKFYSQLALVSVVMLGVLFGMKFIKPLAPYFWLSIFIWAFFIFYSVLMYVVGSLSLKNENQKSFTSLVIGFTFGKMLLAVLIIVVYSQGYNPESQLYVVPFFLIYIVYTIFETSFMMRLGNPKK
ncbi:MAG: hypothetical protein R2784_02295 [Saprospiraceae bacterium]